MFVKRVTVLHMTPRTCKHCAELLTNRLPAIFCSVKCRTAAEKLQRPPCKVCGKATNRPRQKHCSPECQAISLRGVVRTLHPRPCGWCKTVFKPKKDGGRIYCSRSCGAKGAGMAKRKERIKTSVGYWQVYRPGHPMAGKTGYLMEHRLIMAEHLGRNLLPSEVVHHLNEDKGDNRLPNLELMTKAEHDRTAKTPKSRQHNCPHCQGQFTLSNSARIVRAA